MARETIAGLKDVIAEKDKEIARQKRELARNKATFREWDKRVTAVEESMRRTNQRADDFEERRQEVIRALQQHLHVHHDEPFQPGSGYSSRPIIVTEEVRFLRFIYRRLEESMIDIEGEA